MYCIMENSEIISTNLDANEIFEEALEMERTGRRVAVVEMDPDKFDAAMKKIQEILQERRGDSRAWLSFLAPTMGTGMMGSKPQTAIESKVVQSNMQEASVHAMEESQKPVNRAEKQVLADSSQGFKKVVKDKDELVDEQQDGQVMIAGKVLLGLSIRTAWA